METFIFQTPHVWNRPQFTEVDFYVTATDREGASTSKYVSMNVSNTYSEEVREQHIKQVYNELEKEMNKKAKN